MNWIVFDVIHDQCQHWSWEQLAPEVCKGCSCYLLHFAFLVFVLICSSWVLLIEDEHSNNNQSFKNYLSTWNIL